MAVFWDKQIIGPYASVSADGLTGMTYATGTVRATEGKRTGKWFWEVTYTGGYYPMIGVIGEAGGVGFTHSSPYCRYYYFNGTKYPTSKYYGAAYTLGDTIGILLNMDAGEISFYKNGVPQGVAYNNLVELGLVYAAINGGSSSYTMTAIANFGATPFKFIPNDLPGGTYSYNGLINLTTINKSLSFHEGEYKKWKGKIEANIEENLVPNMTSDASPSGQAFGDSNLNTSLYQYCYAFMNDDNKSWVSANTPYPHHIGYKLDEPKTISAYTIRSRNYDNNDLTAMVKNWTFEGSNDGFGWKVLDTQSGVTWSSKGLDKTFVLPKAETYVYFRINSTANNGYPGSLVTVGQLKLNTAIASVPAHWSIVSTSLPSSEQFFDQGIENLSQLIERKATTLEPVTMEEKSETLEANDVGKVFSKIVNLKKYLDIIKIVVR